MDLKKDSAHNQEATLFLSGYPALRCTISQVSRTGLVIPVNDELKQLVLNQGDLAELQISTHNDPNTLRIHTAIEHSNKIGIQLSFINPSDPSVRQLVNWFSLNPHSTSKTTANTSNKIALKLSAIAQAHLGPLFDLFLQEADNQLLVMAEHCSSNQQQNKLFEAKAQLRHQGEHIRAGFCQALKQKMESDLSTPISISSGSPSEHENMSLIDLEEFEDWLSIEAIIRRGNERHFKALACLQKRYSKLFGFDVDSEIMPVGVHSICQALQATVKKYNLAPQILPVIYRLFDEIAIAYLDELYDALNNSFKVNGILPNISSTILPERRQQLPAGSTKLPDNKIHSQPDASALNAGASNPALYSTVRDILSLLQQTAGANNSPQADINAPATGDTTQLIDALSALQNNSASATAINDEISLSQWIHNNSNITVSHDIAQLVALVETIFQNIQQYPTISQELTAQIKKLEIPIAKTAILDPEFFTSEQHPAKLFINQLVNLCLNSDLPNKTLEKKFDSVITNINSNFDQDPNVFGQALESLNKINQQQLKTNQRNTDRIIQTYDGRQRVQQAQEAVEREILRRVSPPEAPDIIVDLIQNGWRELLKLTHIQQGEKSDDWHENLETLDQLLLWITSTDTAADSDEKPKIELEADLFSDFLGQKLNSIFPGDYRYQSTVEQIRDTLKGNREINWVPLEKSPLQTSSRKTKLQRELEEANPKLKRWLKRAKNISVGDEFTYLDDINGQSRIKLAWVSDNGQDFLFVNNRGQKVFDFDLVDLANELSKGLTPVETKTEWPLVERSLYSTVQQAYEKLAFKSSHDELTGLINRKECQQRLEITLVNSKNNLQTHQFLYLEIDKFALTNNIYGHLAGDHILIELSKIISDLTPEKSLIARMADNEFAILLEHCDVETSKAIAEKIRHTIELQEFQWQGHKLSITLSIGIISINKYTENTVDLLRNSIATCQLAKDSGGNRTYIFKQDAETHQRREKLLGWIDNLNDILTSDKLKLRGQKIVSLDLNDTDPHYEILLAIKSEDGKLESPVEFIEAAECYNRMQRVDRWVLERTFQWLHQFIEQSETPPTVSINLSGNSLNDDQFMDFILELFAQYKVPTDKVCFEVTETATINNLAEAADFIREIKKIGCKFSLDDFGSGNASYQYLKHLPVDHLKIDGLFVQDLANNNNDYALVKSINEIAHLMGKKTIAECAESEKIVSLLKEIGVDYIQGYAVDMPTLLEEIFS